MSVLTVKKIITETDDSVAMRSLKRGLKIEAVSRMEEMQKEERLQNSESFSSLKDEWIDVERWHYSSTDGNM